MNEIDLETKQSKEEIIKEYNSLLKNYNELLNRSKRQEKTILEFYYRYGQGGASWVKVGRTYNYNVGKEYPIYKCSNCNYMIFTGKHSEADVNIPTAHCPGCGRNMINYEDVLKCLKPELDGTKQN